MKRIFTVMFFLIIAFAASAQHTIVKGHVLDSLTRQGEPAAVIQFYRSGETEEPFAFTTTAENGSFSQEIAQYGEYQLRFSNMGRKSRIIGFSVSGQDVLDLGEILIEDDVQSLKAGSVTAQKTLVVMDVDKVVYKVEDDVDSKTSTVLDMLRKVPMVSVDGQDNITIAGTSSFQVYVDGKPNPLLSSNPSPIFKLMPASMVKDIEVITNPGAKYDAEGVGGVLNITTNAMNTGGQSIADGQYGSLTLQGNTRGYGGGLYYSMQKGKLAFSMNGNTSKTYNNGTVSESERIQKMEIGDFVTRTYAEADVRTPVNVANMSLSYEIDSLNLVSIGAGYLGSNLSFESVFETDMNSPFVQYVYDGKLETVTSTNSVTANMDYQHTWPGMADKSLVLSYQFSGTPTYVDAITGSDNPDFAGMGILSDRKTDGYTNSLTHAVQADFSTPLGMYSDHKIDVGAKFIARNSSSEQDAMLYDGNNYISDPTASVDYDFYNNIGALYAEYNGKLGPIGLKAGARYEHTWQSATYAEGEDKRFELDYSNVVPVVSVQYNIGMQQNVGMSYNMRISRPGITYLNPYVDNISDPTLKSYGNPELEAETGHTVNAVYNYFSPKWIVSMTMHYAFTGNGMSQYSFYDDDHVLNTTYGNIITTSASGLNAFVTFIPGQKTRIMFNGGATHNSIRSKELGQNNSGWTGNALLSIQQTLPMDFRLSATMIASARTVTLQGWSSGLVIGTLGLTKSFLDDRLSVSLNGLTHLTGGKGIKIESVAQTKEFLNWSSTSVPLSSITLNLSYSFGKSGVEVKKSRKSIEADSQLNSKSLSESLGTVMQMW